MTATVENLLVGETVRIKKSGEMGIVVADNSAEEKLFRNRSATVKTSEGHEIRHGLSELDVFLPDQETWAFRQRMRSQFPDLYVI
jgi:hypothetical protein